MAFEQFLRENCATLQHSMALPECERGSERLMEAARALLADCPRLKLVVWSPETRDLLGERCYVASELLPNLEEASLAVLRERARKADDPTLAMLATDPLAQAAVLVRQGHAHSALAGAERPTRDVLRAVLKAAGTAPGTRTLSSSFLMSTARPDAQHAAVLFADCGVVIEPTVDELTEIAAASVRTWRALWNDTEPCRVAFLSCSTLGSATHPSISLVAEATKRFATAHPELTVVGEVQADAALNPLIGQRKGLKSDSAANILVFPNLAAGNISYKLVEQLGGYEAYGPILQGTAITYSDLSRGASTAAIVAGAKINMLRHAAKELP